MIQVRVNSNGRESCCFGVLLTQKYDEYKSRRSKFSVMLVYRCNCLAKNMYLNHVDISYRCSAMKCGSL